MSKLPKHKIEPLAPPPGSFDQVVKGAHARRRRRGVFVTSSVAVLALVSGVSFELGSAMSVSQRISAAAGFTDGATTPAVTPAATNRASPTRAPARTKTPKPAATSATAPAPETVTVTTPAPNGYLRGKVVDLNGEPVAGLFVQPGSADHVTFRSTGLVAAVTDDKGEFTIPCPRAPVLVSTWKLNQALTTTTVGREWGATFVGSSQTSPVVPACGKTRAATIVSGGSTITGTVHVTGTCPDTTFPLWVWLDRDRRNSVRINGLRDGDVFRYSGLPAGTHSLDVQGLTTNLDLPAGGALQQDAPFSCPMTPGTGTTTPLPTLTPTPTVPTPTATPTGVGPTIEHRRRADLNPRPTIEPPPTG